MRHTGTTAWRAEPVVADLTAGHQRLSVIERSLVPGDGAIFGEMGLGDRLRRSTATRRRWSPTRTTVVDGG
jgi:hypothetical protein